MIEIKNLTIGFDDRTVLENVNVSFPRTGLFSICGESGSGKTSLLNAISSLILFEGSIKIDGVEIKDLNEKDSALFRLKNIGFVFQDFKLFQSQSVEKNVTFPLSILSNCSEQIKRQKSNNLLKIVNLENYNKRICSTLSGGEKQRVAIARALVNNPKVIVADEPTGSLDEKNGREVLELLKKFSQKTLVIVVTHDLNLAKEYSDRILFIKNKNIVIEDNISSNIEKLNAVFSVREKQKRNPTLPLGFAINHAKQNMKTKRIRGILSTLFMSLGLMGIGLSISFSNSISKDIKRSYSSLIETASISICKKHENQKLKNLNYYDAKDLQNVLGDEQPIRVGVGYRANFEEFFKDFNAFYLESNSKTFFLDELSIRNINDFVMLKNLNTEIFPIDVKDIENDEIVLGLTINQIRNICMNFGVDKSVDGLSNYLKNNLIKVVIDLANVDWQYTDQQIFTLKGFCLSKEPFVAHSNSLFNKIVIEDNMRFPTNEKHSLKEYPWVLEKITYIEVNNKEEFISFIHNSKLADKYLFEICDKSLFVTQLLDKNLDETKFLIPYYCPDDALKRKEIECIISVDDNLRNPIIYNDSGYVNYPSNLVSGFANRTYFSFSEDDLFETIENNSGFEFNKNENEVLKEGVLCSDFSKSFRNPVKFDTNLSKISSGREPLDLDEIVVSSGLINSLKVKDSSDEFLYIATAIREINKDQGIFFREYETSKLRIVGVVNNDKNVIYHNTFWTSDYFAIKNGLKANKLIPRSVSFSLSNDVDIDNIILKLKRAFPQYDIINPLLDINESVDSLCKTISIFVFCISSVALVISIILLCSCTYLHISDIRKEVALSRCLGIDNKESLKFLYGFTIYSSCLSLLISSIELTFVNVVISYFSAQVLMLPFEFSITIFAYLAMVIASIGICFLTSIICGKYIKKIKPTDCLKI